MSTAYNALIYGHTWYLDAVTGLPDWKWEGLVLGNVPESVDGQEPAKLYKAVLPIPLRRRWGRWIVYQPLFCQFLAIFSEQPIEVEPLLRAVYARYRHVSTWHLLLEKPVLGSPSQVRQQVMYTHVLPLQNGTETYTADRRMNLRRAAGRIRNVPDWQLSQSTDIEPLLALFCENHATGIGVADWAYDLFRGLFSAIQQQGLGTLHYAYASGQIVAGALFVEQHGRIIYLFNAANAEGRRLNARSVILNQLIQEEQEKTAASVSPIRPLLDFESPEKPEVIAFYKSFGAEAQPFIALTWSQLSWLERAALAVMKQLRQLIS